jgi:hypothetical protein
VVRAIGSPRIGRIGAIGVRGVWALASSDAGKGGGVVRLVDAGGAAALGGSGGGVDGVRGRGALDAGLGGCAGGLPSDGGNALVVTGGFAFDTGATAATGAGLAGFGEAIGVSIVRSSLRASRGASGGRSTIVLSSAPIVGSGFLPVITTVGASSIGQLSVAFMGFDAPPCCPPHHNVCRGQ